MPRVFLFSGSTAQADKIILSACVISKAHIKKIDLSDKMQYNDKCAIKSANLAYRIDTPNKTGR